MPAKTVNVKSSSGTSRNVRNVALAASVPERVPTRVPATFRTTMNDRKMTVEGMSDPVLPAGSAHSRSERRAPLAVAADNFG
mgnify:CR=1 FL=1